MVLSPLSITMVEEAGPSLGMVASYFRVLTVFLIEEF
jgi:hypothetical protein